jgi:L,D-transpeptidase ErfK/SrfK
MNTKIASVVSTFFLFYSYHAFAATYSLPNANEALVGQVQNTVTNQGDNVVSIAKQFDLGYNAIESANPQLQMEGDFPAGSNVQIPTQHLLPNLPRKGIVINLPEMRMYYFPKGSGEVLTYPIGIGKIGKTIPITLTSVARKTKDPIWMPPEDIREFNLKQGVVLPRIMPAGPDNPLGPFAIYTRIPTYLMHSTPFPESIGKRASFGCIRMYESDIQNFFPSINSGIPIAIINSPVKVGWQDEHLYVEAHKPLEEHDQSAASLAGMVSMVSDVTKNSADTLVDWQMLAFVAKAKDGVPHEVGVRVR